MYWSLRWARLPFEQTLSIQVYAGIIYRTNGVNLPLLGTFTPGEI